MSVNKVNPFLRDPENYIRDINVLKNARKQTAFLLHQRTGRPMDQCLEYVTRQTGPGGKFEVKSKKAKVLLRKENGDRTKAVVEVDRIIKKVEDEDDIITPNMVAIRSAKKLKSPISDYIDTRMKQRSVAKKKKFAAGQENDKVKEQFWENIQAGIKVMINSISGAHASPHNPLYDKTSHSILTSNCRIATSSSNASTERFLAGNRHYRNLEVTINNILSIAALTDREALAAVIEKYNLYIPSVKDCLDIVQRSTRFYWRSDKDMAKVKFALECQDDLSRTAFAYMGDMFHLAKYNDTLVRDWLGALIKEDSNELIPAEKASEKMKSASADIIALVGILCSDQTAGMKSDEIYSDPKIVHRMANVTAGIEGKIEERRDLIETLFSSDNGPISIWYFPHAVRRVVVGSDTDSTMFTCQDWVRWFFGKQGMGFEQRKLSSTVAYLNIQCIGHLLAGVSRSMGVEDAKLYRLEMKNEFGFLAYARANRAKHYATLIDNCEGNVYAEPKLEIKGVGLKDSKVPAKIMNALADSIKSNLLLLLEDKLIPVTPIFQEMANLEHEIIESIQRGETDYLTFANIKNKKAYKNPDVSNYRHHMLWEEVFQKHYGTVIEAPYRAVKINVDLERRVDVEKWLSEIDPVVTEELRAFFNKMAKVKLEKKLAEIPHDELNHKAVAAERKRIEEGTSPVKFTNFILPLEALHDGIPKDIISAIDIRKIVSELMGGWYIWLEILGIHTRNKHHTRLISDEYPYEIAEGS